MSDFVSIPVSEFEALTEVERVREVLRPFAMFWEVFRDSRLSDEEFARLQERFTSACESAHVLYRDLETVPF